MFNLISIAGAGAALVYLRDTPAYLVGALALCVIAFIILGEKSRFEESWENAGLPGREALAPVLALTACVALGIIGLDRVNAAIASKSSILALILSFAVVSNGLAKSGFFEFAAYKIVEKCGGDTRRLILYLFILSSILTFFTSNDIVVLTLTPIIYSVCVGARMDNGKLLLLSQFVAANTLAIALMIGSPTNIIISQYFGINFLEYFVIMVVPGVFAFLLSLVVVDFINQRSRVQATGLLTFARLGWRYTEQYRVPARVPWSEFTPSMGRWLTLFAGAILTLMVVTHFDASLFWVAIPLALGSALLLIYELAVDERFRDMTGAAKAETWVKAVALLPYGIVFFAIAFFVFADYIADTPAMMAAAGQATAFAESNSLIAGPASVIGSGILVNLFNDLPAAALLGEMFQQPFSNGATDPITRTTLIQGMLVGLNIGCYLTPVGALAGLLWFNQMRAAAREHRAQHAARLAVDPRAGPLHEIATPTRLDLILYGALHFFFTGIVVGLFLPFSAVLIDVFVQPVRQIAEQGLVSTVTNPAAVTMAGLMVVLLVTVKAREIVAKNQVALSHMSEVFTILNRLAIWSYRRPLLYLTTLLLIFLFVTGGLVFWAETTSIQRYGVVDGASEGSFSVAARSLIVFVSWFFVLFGSSYEQEMFPQSLLGQFLSGLMPLTALGAVLYVVRSTSTDSLAKLRTALGEGKIPNYRILVVNHQARFEQTIRRMLRRPGAFAVLLCRRENLERANTFANSLLTTPELANRLLIREIDADAFSTLRDLDFASASEIFFLSDMTADTDIDNMRLLTRIDVWLGEQRIAAAEELERLQRAAAATGDRRSHGDFLGVPKVFFEASSRRQLARIESTLSDLLRYQTVLAAIDDVVAEQFVSDIHGDLDTLNRKLGFGRPKADYSSLFSGQTYAFANFRITDLDASKESARVLTDFFHAHFKDENRQGRTAKTYARSLRAQFPKLLATARTESNGELRGVPADIIVGIRAPLGTHKLRMTLANAIVSAQAREADGWVVLDRDVQHARPAAAPEHGGSRRVFVFNFNPYAEALIREIIFSPRADQTVIIMVAPEVNIPNDIASQHNVRILRWKTVEDAIGVLVPTSRRGLSDNAPPPRRPEGFNDITGLEEGDSVVVFTDYEHERQSSVEIVQFIEGLDFRLGGDTRGGAAAAHRHIYLGVECNNEETRFLFEHLSVDKIIDTSRLRRALIEQAVDFYHGSFARMHNASYAGSMANAHWGQFHPTMHNFRRAFAIADAFKGLTAELAETATVTDDRGLRRPVIGLKLSELATLCLCYSDPPVALATVFKVRPQRFSLKDDGELGAGVQLEAMDYDPDYVVQSNDLLVFIANL
ncbi:MAG: SLC13 family permease [Hyphomonadaceae bacterium]